VPPDGDPLAGREVYFEFQQVGVSMKVTAIDAQSGTEVSVVVPSHGAQSDMEALAAAKLRRTLFGPRDPGTPDGGGLPPKRGIVA
jgi:hypothetical protein